MNSTKGAELVQMVQRFSYKQYHFCGGFIFSWADSTVGFTAWLRLGGSHCQSAMPSLKQSRFLMVGLLLPRGRRMCKLCSSVVLGRFLDCPPALPIALHGCSTLDWLIFHCRLTAWKGCKCLWGTTVLTGRSRSVFFILALLYSRRRSSFQDAVHKPEGTVFWCWLPCSAGLV